MKKTIIKGSLLVAVLGLAITLSGCQLSLKSTKLTPDVARLKTEKYINDNLMAPGTKAKVDSITEENGLYKLSVNIGNGQVITSYMTEDGSKFFPESLNMASSTAAAAANTANTTTPAANITKSDKPKVELFVMSYCPYGTQMEKGILPAEEALGNSINFSIKFCDYSMHGDKELTENMVQYCIEKDQTSKYDTYLKCFLNGSDSAACVKTAKVDQSALNSCVSATDKKYSVMAKKEMKGSYPAFNVFKDDNAKYNVGGSPTLIINGAEAQGNRDSASLLATICSAFNNAPKACSTKLSTATPSAGFGSGTGASGGQAGCATN